MNFNNVTGKSAGVDRGNNGESASASLGGHSAESSTSSNPRAAGGAQDAGPSITYLRPGGVESNATDGGLEGLLMAAGSFAKAGDFGRVLHYANAALKVSPTNELALGFYYHALMEQGRNDEALGHIDEMLAKDLNEATRQMVLHAKVSLLWDMGKNSLLEGPARELLRLLPDDSMALISVGCILVGKGELDEGKLCLDRLEKKQFSQTPPFYTTMLLNFGVIAMKKKDNRELARRVQQLKGCALEDAEGNIEMGKFLTFLRRKAEALGYWRKADELSKGKNETVVLAIFSCLLELKNRGNKVDRQEVVAIVRRAKSFKDPHAMFLVMDAVLDEKDWGPALWMNA